MIRHALRAALLACVLFVPVRVMAQTQPITLPTVRLFTQYTASDPSGTIYPGGINSVVMLCPNMTNTGTAYAQLCPGSSPGNPLYVSGGASGGSGGTAAVIPVTTVQTNGTTSPSSGTWTQLLAAPTGGAVRKGCTVQNTSGGTEYVFFGPGAPSGLAIGLAVAAGTPLDCAHGGLVVAQDTVWIASAGASASYVLLAQ